MGRNIADFNTGRGIVNDSPEEDIEDTGENFDWMQTNLSQKDVLPNG
jgi:hypothetical protein